MLRLVLLVYLQLILASSGVTHLGASSDTPGLKPSPAPKADTGGGLDPWGSPLKPAAPTTDGGGGYDPWG